MLVSIIVPVYNVEKYITRSFNSIINQSFANIECIFIDDCSTDNSIIILNELINKYNGNISFKILQHENNRGASAARNTGIKNANGEYVFFLDSDDEIKINGIYYLLKQVEKYKNVDIVQGNIENSSAKKNKNIYDIVKNRFPEYTNNQLWLKKHFFLQPRIPITPWNKLIKRSFIIENKLYFKEGIIHEDVLWIFFLAKKIRTMVFTNQYSYIYYDNPDSVMHSRNILKSIQSKLIIIQDMLENIDMEIQREEKLYIYFILRSVMYKINTTSESRQLLPEYRKVIKKCIKNAYESYEFISVLGLYLFFLPCQIYSNYVIRKMSLLLLSNCFWNFYKRFL